MISWFTRKKKTHVIHPAKKGSDDFVSLSSHELRSPLSVIKWYTEILLDEDAGKLTDDQKKYLTLIESSNQRAIDLIRALLNVSRLDLGTFSISPENCNLKDLVQESLLATKVLADTKKVTCTFEESGHISDTLLDKNVSVMMIKSLLHNAVSFSHDGQEVKLSISHVASGKTFLGTTLLDESYVLTVTDTGIGIPESELSKIGTKMYKASNAGDREGTGLSLYIAKTVMEKVHGSFGFISEEGKGSTFFLAFPVRGMEKKSGRTTLE